MIAEKPGVQADPQVEALALAQEKLGIRALQDEVKRLQEALRIQPVQNGPLQSPPRDWKTTVADTISRVADAIGKTASTPDGGETGKVMLQRLLARDELMNQYLYKLIFGEMPARHVTVERKP